MSAGTLTLTNNSALVSGTGTTFSTELSAGDFIVVTVGGVSYTLPVKSVESGTALTLVSNFTGPTQSGAAWSAVPRVALNMVTTAMVVQNTEALRGLNYDKQNWQQVFSAPGMITVKLPDGSSFPGPSWKYLADNMATKSNGAVPVNQGGTGATTSSEARTSLGLGTAATLNTGVSAGNVPVLGNANIAGSQLLRLSSSNTPGIAYASNYTAAIAAAFNIGNNAVNAASAVIAYERGGQFGCLVGLDTDNKFKIGGWSMGGVAYEFYHQGNTVVDGNGYLKKASPVVKVSGDGRAVLNAESEGVEVERTGTGVYRISGVLGFNSDPAWGGIDGGIEIPLDRNKQPLLWVDYKIESDGSILLKTYHRTHPSAPEFARNLIGYKPDDGNFIETIKEGEPVDIPEGRWVDLRVEMPADSIFNQRQEEMRVAMEQAEQTGAENQQDTQS
ncbi:phage tail protein [Citrobacter braakii]|uniref:phage tail fiber protein n=1 Tax=Citrobacter braakii TaxID=57706 RepID=UPI003D6DB7CF